MESGMVITAPSILAADFSRLGEAVTAVEESGAEWIHIDLMDGHFVPNLSFSAKTVADIRPLTKLTFDCHLMVDNPRNYIDSLAKAGADYCTFHAEAAVHSHRVIQDIRAAGMKPGISIVPGTPASVLEELLDEVDQILVMSVNPGFGGQKIIPFCLDKIARLARTRRERGCRYLLAVDGGITLENASIAIAKGADVIIAGSAFFDARDKSAAVKKLKGL